MYYMYYLVLVKYIYVMYVYGKIMTRKRTFTVRVDESKWSIIERFRAIAVKRNGRAWSVMGDELILALTLYLEKYEK